jgi:hypothetical protein
MAVAQVAGDDPQRLSASSVAVAVIGFWVLTF